MLREQAGRSEESLETQSETPLALYAQLRDLQRINIDVRLLRAVVNERYVEMDQPLRDGDRVVFIPPVAGG